MVRLVAFVGFASGGVSRLCVADSFCPPGALGLMLPKAGGNSEWRASPRRPGIFPECVVVVRTFLSHEKPIGVYK
jgi:hypothetical protein